MVERQNAEQAIHHPVTSIIVSLHARYARPFNLSASLFVFRVSKEIEQTKIKAFYVDFGDRGRRRDFDVPPSISISVRAEAQIIQNTCLTGGSSVPAGTGRRTVMLWGRRWLPRDQLCLRALELRRTGEFS